MTGTRAQPAALLPPGFEYRRVGVDGVTINHWFFLPAGHDVPERLIGADPA